MRANDTRYRCGRSSSKTVWRKEKNQRTRNYACLNTGKERGNQQFIIHM